MFSMIEPSVITHFPKRLVFSVSKTFYRSVEMRCLSNSVGRRAGCGGWQGSQEQGLLRLRQRHPNGNQQASSQDHRFFWLTHPSIHLGNNNSGALTAGQTLCTRHRAGYDWPGIPSPSAKSSGRDQHVGWSQTVIAPRDFKLTAGPQT